jgi:hypothetical protein
MIDDLVKRLRVWTMNTEDVGLRLLAADRIEQLETALREKNPHLYELIRVCKGEIPDTEIYGFPVMCDGERIFPRLGNDVVLFAARAALGEKKDD